MARLIAEKYAAWEQLCTYRFETMKANEEKLNRIFHEIYGLQGVLSPEVETKAVSVARAELRREIRSLISYAIGTLFGRYSLDTPGIAYAGGSWDPRRYQTIQPVPDNILILGEAIGEEANAADLVFQWVETVYGAETLEENLSFIAKALGGEGSPRQVIAAYIYKDFYADHLKTYQKRPIYWQFDAGRKGRFKALIYIHRYGPELPQRLLTGYVQPRLSGCEALQSFADRLQSLADRPPRLELDDGIAENYSKFPGLLTPIR